MSLLHKGPKGESLLCVVTFQSKAKQSKTKQVKAKQSKSKRKARQSKAKQSRAQQSKPKQSTAKQSKAKQNTKDPARCHLLGLARPWALSPVSLGPPLGGVTC